MVESLRPAVRRAAGYVIVAALLGLVVGYFREGAGGALVTAFAVGLGAAGGILVYELAQRTVDL